SLLWLALAGPQSRDDRGTEYVILLDGSADMARGDCLSQAIGITGELISKLPRSKTTLVYANATPNTLLAPGEAELLFESRSAELTPSAAPETITDEILRLARETRAPESKRTIYIVGEAVLSGALQDSLTKAANGNLTIQRVKRTKASAPAAQDGNGPVSGVIAADDHKPAGEWDNAILALGMAPAASGTWGAVDLWIETAGEAPPVIEGIDGIPVEPAGLERGTGWWVRDLDLDGLPPNLKVSAAPSLDPHAYALDLDDRASLLVPQGRGAIGVWLADALPSAFADAVAADPGLFLAAKESAAVAIGDVESLAGATGAQWTLAPRGELEASIVATSRGASFSPIFHSLDLASVEQATEAGATNSQRDAITFAERKESGPALWSDAALFEAPYELVESRSFPLLVGLAARWLAETQTILPFAMAGRALPDTNWDRVDSTTGVPYPSAGGRAVPPSAGEYLGVTASLLSPITSGSWFGPGLLTNQSTAVLPTVLLEDVAIESSASWVTLLALLALLLLGIEWYVFRTGRMP
ncbi:MAG: hypothetical protein KDB61_06075, partial [Planctomycetes bacterium]|nr:hypothetical protein [Planctomycetota bacterium]